MTLFIHIISFNAISTQGTFSIQDSFTLILQSRIIIYISINIHTNLVQGVPKGNDMANNHSVQFLWIALYIVAGRVKEFVD